MIYPKIKIKDLETGVVRDFGSNHHDRLYIDKNGALQYMSMQHYGTTEKLWENHTPSFIFIESYTDPDGNRMLENEYIPEGDEMTLEEIEEVQNKFGIMSTSFPVGMSKKEYTEALEKIKNAFKESYIEIRKNNE